MGLYGFLYLAYVFLQLLKTKNKKYIVFTHTEILIGNTTISCIVELLLSVSGVLQHGKESPVLSKESKQIAQGVKHAMLHTTLVYNMSERTHSFFVQNCSDMWGRLHA